MAQANLPDGWFGVQMAFGPVNDGRVAGVIRAEVWGMEPAETTFTADYQSADELAALFDGLDHLARFEVQSFTAALADRCNLQLGLF